MPKAFVTGGTGFLGLNLIQALTHGGWEVTALHRPDSELKFLRRFNPRLKTGSVEDLPSLLAALPDRVDAVFHVAGKTGFWRPNAPSQESTNVLGTRNMVRAALERKTRRFIHTSSFVAYGHLGTRITEDTRSDAADSKLAYLRTKYLGEQEVRAGIAQGLDAVILNPTHILGPFDAHNWGRSFLMAHTGRLPSPPGYGSFCHAQEVARAHLKAFERGRTGENYLLACVDASFLDMAREVCRLLGKRPAARPVPAWVLHGVARAQDIAALFTRREPDLTRDIVPLLCAHHTASGEKARRELDYRPRTLPEILSACH
ncbi:MAG: NAD-dependent epimerase/dehydratase family protein, partial [Deltaproteobacteria bacterium]|nr:NAD-dependent epimerase/dehydratase family protein [Deltaproteobacteria bacterium]